MADYLSRYAIRISNSFFKSALINKLCIYIGFILLLASRKDCGNSGNLGPAFLRSSRRKWDRPR